MDKDDVIRQVTSELLEEIKKSNKSFTNEEVKEKINKKLNAFFDGEKIKEESLKADLEEEDQILNNEFTKICNDEDLLTSSNFNVVEDSNSNDCYNIDDKKEVKKKFFQEIKNIYKNEFENSISCFKNAMEVFKFTRKTSLFETILILIFLAIPAILAGSIAIIVVIILFLLWQLYLIIKSILELFKKVEVSIKGFNDAIKRKIRAFKNSGGFINRLILSNALYSLMMFNGVMYMLIKGLMLPLKSALDAEKIVANLLAKLEKGLTTVLKAPSELTLASTKTEAAKSRTAAEKQKDGKAKTKTERKKEKVVEKIKPIEKEKAQVRNQQKAEKQDEVSRALHQSRAEVADAIAKNLQVETSQQKVQDIGDKVVNLAEQSDRQRVPMSSALSPLPFIDFERGNVAREIFNNIVEGIGKSIEKVVEGTEGVLRDNNPQKVDNKELIEKAERYFQEQRRELQVERAGVESEEQLKTIDARDSSAQNNAERVREDIASGKINSEGDLRESLLKNEANDPREIIENSGIDPKIQAVMLDTNSRTDIEDSAKPQAIAFELVKSFKEQGFSDEDIQNKMEDISPVLQALSSEYKDIEEVKKGTSMPKKENESFEGFVSRTRDAGGMEEGRSI